VVAAKIIHRAAGALRPTGNTSRSDSTRNDAPAAPAAIADLIEKQRAPSASTNVALAFGRRTRNCRAGVSSSLSIGYSGIAAQLTKGRVRRSLVVCTALAKHLFARAGLARDQQFQSACSPAATL
jgi:hypothetical protein